MECEKKSDTNIDRGQMEPLKKSFRKYLSHLPGMREIKELHKTAILGTAHVLRKVLM
jgi:hypothetical protein